MVCFPFYAVNLDDSSFSNIWTHCTALPTFLHAPYISLFIYLLFLYFCPYDILSDILLPLVGNKGGSLEDLWQISVFTCHWTPVFCLNSTNWRQSWVIGHDKYWIPGPQHSTGLHQVSIPCFGHSAACTLQGDIQIATDMTIFMYQLNQSFKS